MNDKQKNKITQAILSRLCYIGEDLPQAIAEDKRPKFVMLGTPQEFIDEILKD